MNTRTAVITGASTGLGLECARALLRTDASWHVVLAVRDGARGADAVAQLGEATRCSVLDLDLASLESVRGFSERMRAAGLPPVHVIVCNAGVQVVSGTQSTADGFEMTFGVNHLGHFALVKGGYSTSWPARHASSSSAAARTTRATHRHAGTALHLRRGPRLCDG